MQTTCIVEINCWHNETTRLL